MLDIIREDDLIYAIIIRAGYRADGIEFFTPGDFSQQLAYMNRPQGYTIQPHYHPETDISITKTQEVLFVRTGKVRVELFSVAGDRIREIVIAQGDVILLAAGGHSFEMLEDSELIEVKQGPYNGTAKIMFEPKAHDVTGRS